MKTSALLTLLALALALATVTACQPKASSLLRSDSDPGDDESPSAPAQKPKKTGETAPPDKPTTDSPGAPGKPLDPNGFTAKIAPLLDAQGCTECHHAGRPIDLTKYPFMAGDDKDTADRLTRSLAGTMPPAPRDRAPASLTDAIAAWRTAGMKP